MDTVGVRKELAEYITSEIIPAYAAFPSAPAAGKSGKSESRGDRSLPPAQSSSLFRFLVKYITTQSTRKRANVPMSKLPDSIVSKR